MFDVVLNKGDGFIHVCSTSVLRSSWKPSVSREKHFEAQDFYQAFARLDCGLNGLPEVSRELSDWLESILTFLPNRRVSDVEEALATLPLPEGPREPLVKNQAAHRPRLNFHPPPVSEVLGADSPLGQASVLDPTHLGNNANTYPVSSTLPIQGGVSEEERSSTKSGGVEAAVKLKSPSQRKNILIWIVLPFAALVLILAWLGWEALSGQKQPASPVDAVIDVTQPASEELPLRKAKKRLLIAKLEPLICQGGKERSNYCHPS